MEWYCIRNKSSVMVLEYCHRHSVMRYKAGSRACRFLYGKLHPEGARDHTQTLNYLLGRCYCS